MKLLIVFNSKYWDRSSEALYRELSKRINKSITSLRMPGDFHDLIRLHKETNYDAIILIGDFSCWDYYTVDNIEVSDYLKTLFLESRVPRLWVLINDLHHHADDLLNGRKTLDDKLRNTNISTEFDHMKYFDMLAWPYEHIENISEKFDLPDQVFSENRVLHLDKMAVAMSTFDKLKNAFPSRMEFYHCVDTNEFRLFPKILYRLKLMKFYVPGRRYPTRSYIESRLIKLKMIKTHQLVASSFVEIILNKSIVLISRIFPENSTKRYKNFVRFQKHIVMLSLGKFVWVDGSYSNYPVRKYFEIPMCNSLMLTVPSSFLKSLGFQGDVNCFTMYPGDIGLNKFSFHDLEKNRYISMINAAKEIILSSHKPVNRIAQLLYFLDNYRSNSTIRGFYENNKFIVSQSN